MRTSVISNIAFILITILTTITIIIIITIIITVIIMIRIERTDGSSAYLSRQRRFQMSYSEEKP